LILQELNENKLIGEKHDIENISHKEKVSISPVEMGLFSVKGGIAKQLRT